MRRWLGIGSVVLLGLTACKQPVESVETTTLPQRTVAHVTGDKDAAPEGPVMAPIKKITPKAEPLSRYGNRAEYRVGNEVYEVMPSAAGYRARGLASWYGTKFHQKRTSSGDEYDLFELTAAHKTLPLPTYVKVKNLNNGKEIVVKVNDRGPFHKDRLIDLSYGAAVKLGFMATGTAPVEIEVLTVGQSSHQPAQYYLQAGAFSSRESAQPLLQKLKKAFSSQITLEEHAPHFLVFVGPLADKHAAKRMKQRLGEQGFPHAFSVLR